MLLSDICVVIIAYLLGSVSFSIVTAKLSKGIDIRQHGSGNAGATNTLRVLGKGPAIAVLVLDILKGVLAVVIAKWIIPDLSSWVPAASALAAICGHTWPIFFGFKGGKGVATTAGVMLTLNFVPALIAFVIAIIIMAITRYVSVGSIIGTALIPLLMWLNGTDSTEILLATLVFVLVTFRHRSNLVKLMNGTENKLGARKTGEQS